MPDCLDTVNHNSHENPTLTVFELLNADAAAARSFRIAYSSLGTFAFCLRLAQFSDDNLRLSCARVVLLSSFETRRDTHRQVLAIRGEGKRPHAVGDLLVLLHPPLRLRVPQCHSSVTATGCERPILWVESESIDGIDNIAAALLFWRCLTMAFERILTRL